MAVRVSENLDTLVMVDAQDEYELRLTYLRLN